MKIFKINQQEYIELCDLLKATGLCDNGAHAKHEIANNQVQVDGVIETRKRCKIRPKQIVLYKDETILVEKE